MLLVEPLPKKNMMRLARDYRFLYNEKFYTVPDGFVWDGFSNPKLFHGIMPSSFEPRVLESSLVHDYFYRTHEISRDDADQLLFDMLIKAGIDREKSKAVFFIVQAFGGSAWEESIKKPLIGVWTERDLQNKTVENILDLDAWHAKELAEIERRKI